MLLFLTFGAVVNSPRFYLGAWGEEPFVSPLPVGDAVMPSSSCSPLQGLSFGHVRSCKIVHNAASSAGISHYIVHSSGVFVLCWRVLFIAALSQLASSCLTGVMKAFFSLFCHCTKPIFPTDVNLFCSCGWHETASRCVSLGPAKGSGLQRVFRCQ